LSYSTGLFATYEAASDTGVTRLAPLDRPGLPSIICASEQERLWSTHDIEAGFDDCGVGFRWGAGIQADIKAMSANGVFAMSAITAITAQNTEEVTDVFELPTSIIAAQIDAVFDDFDVAAVKTGMLSSAAIVEVVVRLLKTQHVTNLVVDPVMISKTGHALLKPEAIDAVKTQLFPLALLSRRTSMKPSNSPAWRSRRSPTLAAPPKSFTGSAANMWLIKGVICRQIRATDLLYEGPVLQCVQGGNSSIPPHTHGTGCTFASAIADISREANHERRRTDSPRPISPRLFAIGWAIGHGSWPNKSFLFLQT